MKLSASLVAALLCAIVLAAGLPGPDGASVVVRGVGWSPWHSTEHWNHSAETRKLDRRYLHEAHINALRSWGQGTPQTAQKLLEEGFLFIPTIHCREGLKAQFPDGSTRGLAFSDPTTREAFAQRVEEHVAGFRGLNVPLCFLLGNEYTAVGYYPPIKNYQYTGFEPETQQRFRDWMIARFGTLEKLNEACGTQFAAPEDIRPLTNARTRYEWWLFLNRTFEQFIREAHEAVKRADPDRLTSYAKLMGTHWDPYTEDASLSFLDIGGDNLYWHWAKNWARFDDFLNDLIAAAKGRPVLLTEGGFQSKVLGEERAGRLMKQMLWNAFMHPEVAGFCVYAYSDEWYVDGKPEEQAPGESWGIVTADRKIKPSYRSVAEVYAIIEEMNDFFASCQAPPAVAVSNQALGYNVERKSTSLHTQIGRVLYSEGIPLKSTLPVDLYDMDPVTTPRLIFCDELFGCEPGGSHSALEAFLQYVREGGQVLYLCPEPWRMVYGQARVPDLPPLVPNEDGRCSVNYGRGRIDYIARNEFEPDELRETVLAFLAETHAPRRVLISTVRPVGSRDGCYCRLLQSGGRQVLLCVNETDAKLDLVDLIVTGASSAKLLHADGARLAFAGVVEGGARLRLRDLDTYALIELTPE